MKTIFITGASAGLGKAAVKLFADKGWRVIATMRTPSESLQENVIVLPLDVTNPDQIKETVAKAIAIGPVDVVFNNAGYGLMGPLESATDEQVDRQLNTNLMGVIRVVRAFIPHFREQRSGMFITTTSIGGLVTFPFSAMYHATKWALEGFSECLSYELRGFGVKVKTIAPGGISSDFAGRSLDLSHHPAYEATFQRMSSQLSEPTIFKFSSASDIAEEVYEAVTDDKDQVHYVAGDDAKAFYAQRLEVGAEEFRKGIAKLLVE
jgi:NAD(P)-dependent dehydrogenase (short-subunit alcohol dehydrogenase family)